MRSVFRSGICFAVRFTPTASPEAIFQNLLTTTQIRQIRSPPAHLRNAPPCRLEDSRSGRSRGRQKHRKTVLRRPDGKPGPWRGGRHGGTSSAAIPGGGRAAIPHHSCSSLERHSSSLDQKEGVRPYVCLIWRAPTDSALAPLLTLTFADVVQAKNIRLLLENSAPSRPGRRIAGDFRPTRSWTSFSVDGGRGTAVCTSLTQHASRNWVIGGSS